MFAMTCDFHENLWECLICWIWTVIKSNRKRLQLEEHHELNHISSTTCQSRELAETSQDWKSQQTLNCSVVFYVKFFADGDEDLEPDTWSPIGIWRASLITIVQQMPSSQTNKHGGPQTGIIGASVQNRAVSTTRLWQLWGQFQRQLVLEEFYFLEHCWPLTAMAVRNVLGKEGGGRVISYLGTVVTTTPGLYWPLQGRLLSLSFTRLFFSISV